MFVLYFQGFVQTNYVISFRIIFRIFYGMTFILCWYAICLFVKCGIILYFRQGSKVEQFQWLVIPCINIFEKKYHHHHRYHLQLWPTAIIIIQIPYCLSCLPPQIAKFMGPRCGPPGSCRPQKSPMMGPWTLLSGSVCWRFNELFPQPPDHYRPSRYLKLDILFR